MKIIKRIFSILLSVVIIIPVLKVTAEKSLNQLANGPITFDIASTTPNAYSFSQWRMYKDSFSNPDDFSEAYGFSKKFGADTNSYFVGNEDGSKKQYGGRYSSIITTNNINPFADLSLSQTQSYRIFSFDFAIESLKSDFGVVINPGTGQFKVMEVKNGILNVLGGKEIGQIEAQKWYNIKFYETYNSDSDNCSYNVYLNNYSVIENIGTSAIKTISLIRYLYYENTDINNDGTYRANGMYLDNINITASDYVQSIDESIYDPITNTDNDVNIFAKDSEAKIILKGKFAAEICADAIFDGNDKYKTEHPFIKEADDIFISKTDCEKLFGHEVNAKMPRLIDGVEYVSLYEEATTMEYVASYNGKGLYVFSDTKINFESDARWEEAAKYMFFERYTTSQLKQMINYNVTESCLFGGKRRFDELKSVLNGSNTEVKGIVSDEYNRIISEADEYLNKSNVTYTITGGRLLAVSQEFKRRAVCEAFAYCMTDSEKYKTKLLSELDAVLEFPDWHESHFLDTAEIALGVSTVYDWLYNELGDERRQAVEQKLNDYFLSYAQKAYSGELSGSEYFWASTRINWGMVTNGSAAVAAIVLFRNNPDKYSLILKNALRACEKSFYMFAGSGSWDEGEHYWEYTMEYTCYMMSALDSFFGSDLGLSNLCGFDNSAYFQIMLDSPQGTNNFHDGYSTHVQSPVLFYLGNKFNNTDFTSAKLLYNSQESIYAAPTTRTKAFELMWYDLTTTDADIDISPDGYFSGIEAVSMREQWLKNDGVFVSFHGGENTTDHAHIDAGAFVYDNRGVRWGIDLGIQNYATANEQQQANRRGLQGHNTLEFRDGSGQNKSEFAEIIKKDNRLDEAYAIMDLSKVYAADAESVKRGIRLFEKRRVTEIRDEIRTPEQKNVIWRMNTKANIDITADGFYLFNNTRSDGVEIKINTNSANVSKNVLNEDDLNFGLSDGTKQLVIEFSTQADSDTYLSVMIGERELLTEETNALDEWKTHEPDVEIYSNGKRTYRRGEENVTMKNTEAYGDVICGVYSDDGVLKEVKKLTCQGENLSMAGIKKIFWFDSLNGLKPEGKVIEW